MSHKKLSLLLNEVHPDDDENDPQQSEEGPRSVRSLLAPIHHHQIDEGDKHAVSNPRGGLSVLLEEPDVGLNDPQNKEKAVRNVHEVARRGAIAILRDHVVGPRKCKKNQRRDDPVHEQRRPPGRKLSACNKTVPVT